MKNKKRQGVNSVITGMKLVKILVDAGQALPLHEIAVRSEMTATKVHRYLVSLVVSGIVSQSREGGPYGLGPFALKIGAAAIGRSDRNALANEALEKLQYSIDESAHLSVPSEDGPVVIALIALSNLFLQEVIP
jgi:DNA-binding IclR family transcriptional regulator